MYIIGISNKVEFLGGTTGGTTGTDEKQAVTTS